MAAPTAAPVVEISGVTKAYGALRPLRLQSLTVRRGERVSIAGLDAAAAETLINLITGASLPDAGEIRVFGRRTADVADGDEWLTSLDRYGIVSDRAVLLEGATLAENLALPLTLEIDPLAPEMRARAGQLAEECDILPAWLEQPCAQVPAEIRVRTHLARAVALDPELLLMEHPTALLEGPLGQQFGELVRRVAEARRLTVVMVSMDAGFAAAAAARSLTLEAASGALKPARRGWFR